MQTLDDFMTRLSNERRGSISDKAAALQLEIRSLDTIRAIIARSMAGLASTTGRDLEMLECAADAYTAALRETIEEAGGSMDIVIRMPGLPSVHVERLSDLRFGASESGG